MKHFTTLTVALAAAALLVAGCAAPVTPTASHGGPVTGYVSLVDALRAAGATIELAGEVEQPFFAVKGQVIKVNGGDVQVFEYADEASAQTDADKVGPDGSQVGTSIVDWIAPPHFYKNGRLIGLYVGTDGAITSLLEGALGAQFAGG